MRAAVRLGPWIVASLAFVVGCGAVEEKPLAKEHPANPAAPEAPLPARSRTLDLAAADSPSTTPAREADHAAHGDRGVHGPTPPARFEPTPATSSARPESKALYTCPMDPEVVSDKPGRCPKCGMKLEPMKPEGKQ